MFLAFINCIKIPELRKKIFFTLSMIFVARIGASIPLPGLDPKPLCDFFTKQNSSSGGLVGLYDMFTGGAFLKGAIFGLGVMPYISASIILQLLTAVTPSLARIQREHGGRQRIAQYTRYLTVLICLIQGILLVLALANYPEKLFMGFDKEKYGDIVVMNRGMFFVTSTIFLTAGTMILTWFGERITQFGIGNGVSVLITVGILSSLPKAIYCLCGMLSTPLGEEKSILGASQLGLMMILLLIVVSSMVAVTQAVRKIPVQYAKQVIGRKVMGGQASVLPLKVNYAGVMPVIFASTILMFPQQVLAYIGGATGISFFQKMSVILSHGSKVYYTIYGTLILVFSYFWVSIMFKPTQVADDLKRNNGYILGIRPGAATAEFLDFVMTRLTLAGAIFLTVIALLPDLVYFSFGVPYQIAMFFGGTGTLISVGVILETMKQMEVHLLERNYDGFWAKGKIRTRALPSGGEQGTSRDVIEFIRRTRKFWIAVGILMIVGLISFFLRKR
ncbi:MAG: preprotein translocase subunit SecY [Puniceicoccales bacterium]|jgi:preprotein translocase subunit SecY|nr:preprotein translocase subunit SecY [Puniceicoccales bacterium]